MPNTVHYTNVTSVTLPVMKDVRNHILSFAQDYTPSANYQIICNDVMTTLQQIPSDSAMLIMSSPPYNIGKAYEQQTAITAYLAWQRNVLTQCVRILHPRGSLCWQVGTYVNDGEHIPLDTFFYPMCKELGLKLRNRIVWRYRHGLHATKRFSGRYETLLWFTKTDDYFFALDPIRVSQREPNKLQKSHRSLPVSMLP